MTGRQRRRGLSRRRVKRLVRIGQHWRDGLDLRWTIRQIHAKDGLVRLEGYDDDGIPCVDYVSFDALGREYRLEERER